MYLSKGKDGGESKGNDKPVTLRVVSLFIIHTPSIIVMMLSIKWKMAIERDAKENEVIHNLLNFYYKNKTSEIKV